MNHRPKAKKYQLQIVQIFLKQENLANKLKEWNKRLKEISVKIKQIKLRLVAKPYNLKD